MRLLRMTTRRMMILVGISCFLMACEVWRERTVQWISHCREKAAFHARWESEFRRTSVRRACDADTYQKDLESDDLSDAQRKHLRYLVRQRTRSTRYTAELADYYEAMRRKWESAIAHPWLSVPADLPEP
jgi:hypothetical protein